MSQNQYWNTILTAESSSSVSSSSGQTYAPASSLHEQQPPAIPRPEGNYISLSRIRMALEIPDKKLSAETILINYPDWPKDAAPDLAWETILDIVKQSFENSQKSVDGASKWSSASDLTRYQSPALRSEITASILSKLRDKGYIYCADRLSRCKNDWAIEDLLDKRVKLFRRDQRKTSNTVSYLEE